MVWPRHVHAVLGLAVTHTVPGCSASEQLRDMYHNPETVVLMDPVLFNNLANDATGAYGMPAYYDREGTRISILRHSEPSSDPDYKILRTTEVPQGRVISVWIGEDRADTPEGEPPSIFGTILQRSDEDFDHSVEEFATSPEECLASHELLVALLSLDRTSVERPATPQVVVIVRPEDELGPPTHLR